jgi:tRNA-dihydrouridine synthase C
MPAMAILLAPMEGLLDSALRDVLTRVGGVSLCVSEFIRVTDQLLPNRVFTRIVPELRTGGRTAAGVPVRAQLLGSDPTCLADNAARLARLNPAGIDLNFGCPAKIVNRHGGGALLLQDPELIHRIVRTVRQAVPEAMPVSAKMRLGYEDDTLAEDCARAIAEAGASQLVVHGRTKAQGYRPPAYWHRIAHVREAVNIPVVANGEIWTVADALQCQRESGCTDLMLGRGMVADPGLALAVLAGQGSSLTDAPNNIQRPTWLDLQPLLWHFWTLNEPRIAPRHQAGRLKQWLNFLRRVYPEAEANYQALRTLTDTRDVLSWMRAHWAGEGVMSSPT